jgi:phosphotriesterase-related protein
MAGPTDRVTVRTVLGEVPVEELGTTLTHEHLFNDLGEALHEATLPELRERAGAPVTPA